MKGDVTQVKVITLTNQKGGVSKSTTAYALAAGLNDKGKSILIIDADPQGNLSFTAGIDLINLQYSLYEVFKGVCSISEAKQTIQPGMDIVTAGLKMTSADIEFTDVNRAYLLREALEAVKANYDYCIVDTPPTLGVLVMNALTASDEIIIPINADIYSLQGIAQLKQFIDNVRKYCNPDLKINGILVTKYNERTNLTKALMDAIQTAADNLHTKVFNTKIRESVAIKESQLAQGDIFDEAPRASATKDYLQFITEYLEGENNAE